MAKNSEKKAITPAMYNAIKSPVITEKSTMGSQYNQVTFKVALEASKPEIKAAVEAIFNVKVEGVNTTRIKGKAKVFKGRKGQRSDYKKATITLAEGNTIDVAAGI